MLVMIYFKKMVYPIIIIFLLFIIFIQRGCEDNKLPSKEAKEIIIPAKKGSFTSVKPIKIHDTIIKDSIVFKNKKIILTNPVDKKLVLQYLEAKDSISKLKILINSVKINKYSTKFNNEDIDLTIDTETTGTLNSIKPAYIIKEKKVDVPVKTLNSVFALYTGVEIYNNKNLNNPGAKIDLGIQNKKGDIYSLGFDTNKNFFVGYKLRIINIKK